jgi:predicted dehydrogenase
MREAIASGEIGRVRHIEAQFCFMLPAPNNIRFRYELAGGSLMDNGCYPVSLIRFLAGAEPAVRAARPTLYAPEVDSGMSADLTFAGGITAHMRSDMLSPALFRSFVRVEGEAGVMTVVNPYHPHWFHWLSVRGRSGRRLEHVRGGNIYALQLRAFAGAVRDGTKLNTGPQDALANMRLIDAIYEKAGLRPRGKQP